MNLLDGLYPDGVEAVSQCARCHCSVPLDEWEPVAGVTAFRHKGPLRDHAEDRLAEPDDLTGEDTCGWIKKVPRKATYG